MSLEGAKVLDNRWTSPERFKHLDARSTSDQAKLADPVTLSNYLGRPLGRDDVTTLSGRQVEIWGTDLRAAPGTREAPQFAPTLDVIPSISADGFCVQMGMTATFGELIGCDDAPQVLMINPVGGGTNGKLPLTAQLPLPHFRV
jgi:hypothetical protein